MKLKYKVGDLVQAAVNFEIAVAAHQCNCFCAMGAGIAPQFAKAIPLVKKVDDETVIGDRGKMGTFTVATVEQGSPCEVYNLYGQYGTSTSKIVTDYEALRLAMLRMKKDIFNRVKASVDYANSSLGTQYSVEGALAKTTVGLPFIGCGLAGGDWAVVSKIIEETLDGFDVVIYAWDQATLDKMLATLDHDNYEISED